MRRVPNHIPETVDLRKGFDVSVARAEHCQRFGVSTEDEALLTATSA